MTENRRFSSAHRRRPACFCRVSDAGKMPAVPRIPSSICPIEGRSEYIPRAVLAARKRNVAGHGNFSGQGRNNAKSGENHTVWSRRGGMLSGVFHRRQSRRLCEVSPHVRVERKYCHAPGKGVFFALQRTVMGVTFRQRRLQFRAYYSDQTPKALGSSEFSNGDYWTWGGCGGNWAHQRHD